MALRLQQLTRPRRSPASGSAVIFDLRIRHRGTANKSNKDRGIVYMSYVREWYSDRVRGAAQRASYCWPPHDAR